jgi:SAM-dependent methyltransferase
MRSSDEVESVCPLCATATRQRIEHDSGRPCFVCGTCALVHVARSHRLDRAHEAAHYGTHDNSPHDPHYRAFLDRLLLPLVQRLSAGAHGLDFGSGPGPTLSVMFEERGFPMQIYDPFFAPDASVLRRRFDFVSCSETVEHFFDPAAEFARFDRLVEPGGWLGIMTRMTPALSEFRHWHYVRDPTHVCFYGRETMQWIAAWHQWELEMPCANVALFRTARPS